MRRRNPLFSGVVAFLCVVVLAGLVPAVARALEPPRPGELKKYAKDGSLARREAFARQLGNDRLPKGVGARLRAEQLFSSAGVPGSVFLPPVAWRGMPTTGNVKILTLLIDFPDYPHHNSTATITSKLFGGGVSANDFPYESLHNYYARSSYNQLNISGDVLGWYRPAYNRSAVTQTTAGRQALIKEALNYYNGLGQDFSQYDNNGDGKIDYFVVVWTGPDNGWANFWWGYQTSFTDSSFTLDGKSLDTYSWQWESRYSGGTTDGVYDQIVVMHETGHALGLPDYYDYDNTVGPNGGVGGLDMMDANWGDHNSFSKWVLDWITPQVVTSAPQSVTLTSSGTTPQALVVMPGASSSDPFKEYFIVQNRQRVGNDSNCVTWPYQDMPGDGLLVWHVDARLNAGNTDYLYDNSYTSHKLLKLMEADGLNQIETVPNYWVEASDYYTSGKTFGPSTNPNSKKYDGTDSNVVVQDIPTAGGSITFTAGVQGAGPATAHISSLSPIQAPAGTEVTVNGSDFGTPGYITFGTHTASVTSWTATQIVCTAPTGETGAVTVRVTPSGASSSNGVTFTYGTLITDATPPVTTMTGATDGMISNTDIVFHLTATDEPGGTGVASISGSFDGAAPWNAPYAAVNATFYALTDHSMDGPHTFSYWATDGAGNTETAHSLAVAIDTWGPVTKAPYKWYVRRGRTAKLYFKVLDPTWAVGAKSTPAAMTARRDAIDATAGGAAKRVAGRTLAGSTQIKIKTLSGRTVKTVTFSGVELGTLYYWPFRCSLRTRTYKFYVYATDLAGNAQRSVGRNKLIVY